MTHEPSPRRKREAFVQYLRRIWKHPYANEPKPWSRLLALMWLINYTQYRAREKRFRDKTVLVPVGHFVASLSMLERRFRWSKPKVLRFLRELQRDETIVPIGVTPAGKLYRFVNWGLHQPGVRQIVPESVPATVPLDVPPTVPKRKTLVRKTIEKSGADAPLRLESEETSPTVPYRFAGKTYDALQRTWTDLFGTITPSRFRAAIKPCFEAGIRPAQIERAMHELREETSESGKNPNINWLTNDIRGLIAKADRCALEEGAPELFGLTPEDHASRIEEHRRKLVEQDEQWETAA